MIEGVVSVTEAAAILDLTRQRVLQLIAERRLEASKLGNQWAISRKSVEEYNQERNRSKKA